MKKIIVFIILFVLLCTNETVYATDKVQKKTLKYSVIDDFHDGLARASRNEKGWELDSGFVDTKGEWRISNNGNISSFSEGLAYSGYNKHEYIDKKGKVAFILSKELSPGGAGHFGTYGDFHDGRAIVRKGRNFNANGVINKAGELVIPCKYWGISNYSHGYAVAAKDNKMGLIDINGKVIVPFVYEYGAVLTDGFMFTKSSNFWEIYEKPCWWSYHESSAYDVYDANANLIMTDNSSICDLDNGIIVAYDEDYLYTDIDSGEYKRGQYKLMDTSGQVIYAAPDGRGISHLGEGMYSLSESYRYDQLMDSKGNLINNTKYGYISNFSGNYAVVREAEIDETVLFPSGKFGVIDKYGNEILPCKYELPYESNWDKPIENGFVILIDSKGKSILFTLPNEN